MTYNDDQLRYTGRAGSMMNAASLLFDNKINQIEDENVIWLDTKEAAKFLRITPNALRILVHRARVRAYKLGSRLRFKKNDLSLVLTLKED
ncbi:MAG: hypothetical protein CME62_12055 [Halobacteriovoraceae bacterium]|nr:hypothetical protein [Halobacteriovoraceae bacterium]|tara:strand:- start:42879 stop:43151 length:273 start_codon:yes stop_codon:yes gene_type:complete